MLDALRRFWRHFYLAVEDKAALIERLQQAEERLYALEQDNKRILATIRKQAARDK